MHEKFHQKFCYLHKFYFEMQTKEMQIKEGFFKEILEC